MPRDGAIETRRRHAAESSRATARTPLDRAATGSDQRDRAVGGAARQPSNSSAAASARDRAGPLNAQEPSRPSASRCLADVNPSRTSSRTLSRPDAYRNDATRAVRRPPPDCSSDPSNSSAHVRLSSALDLRRLPGGNSRARVGPGIRTEVTTTLVGGPELVPADRARSLITDGSRLRQVECCNGGSLGSSPGDRRREPGLPPVGAISRFMPRIARPGRAMVPPTKERRADCRPKPGRWRGSTVGATHDWRADPLRAASLCGGGLRSRPSTRVRAESTR